MRILILGKNGQLGSEFQAIQNDYDHTFFFAGSGECDIRKEEDINQWVNDNSIEFIINCAAYTAVDQAEDDEANAMAVNHLGVININTVAERHSIPYIHISTDYVFDGKGKHPYKTGDPVAPIGVYGVSKQKGEEVVLSSKTNAIIIRTAWVYSSYGNNFVKTMLRLGKERSELNVVADQIGSPTYARDIAKACLQIIDSGKTIDDKQRVYHYSNEGTISWCDFASEIMKQANLDCKVSPITSDQYPTQSRTSEIFSSRHFRDQKRFQC